MNGTWNSEGQNSYLYNGMERNKDFGLDWDMAAFRSYDPVIARFVQMDTKYTYSQSPYIGIGNNPILYSDPLGDTIRIQITSGNLKDTRGNAIVNDNGEVIAGNGFRSVIYTPGMEVTGEGGFVDNVITALNYIYENIDTEAIDQISEDSDVSTIVAYRPTKKGGAYNKNYFDHNSDGQGGSFLMFHPDIGMVFHPDTDEPNTLQYWFGDWGYRSPVEILNHELEHNRSYFENPGRHIRDALTPDSRFHNSEERQAIGVENQAAKILFGDKAKIRNHHGGVYRRAKNGIYPLNY